MTNKTPKTVEETILNTPIEDMTLYELAYATLVESRKQTKILEDSQRMINSIHRHR